MRGFPASTKSVSECGCALLSVSRQNAPGVARAHSHQNRRLVQSHMLCSKLLST